MGLRKWKREIARQRMKAAGVTQINKPPVKGGKKSYFALNWREWLKGQQETKRRKEA